LRKQCDLLGFEPRSVKFNNCAAPIGRKFQDDLQTQKLASNSVGLLSQFEDEVLLKDRVEEDWKWTTEHESATKMDLKETDLQALTHGLNHEQEEVLSSYPSSVSSLDSQSTGDSEYSVQLLSAEQEFTLLLGSEPCLVSLYGACFASANIGAQRFEDNFRRLLKIYARDLQAEAKDQLQAKAAQFVRPRARRVASNIRRNFDPQDAALKLPLSNLEDGRARKRLLEDFLTGAPLADHDSTADEDSQWHDSDSDLEIEEELPTLAMVKGFLLSSKAFEQLKVNFRQFVFPSSKMDETALPHSIPMRIFVKLFLKVFCKPEGPLSPGWQRIRWKCVCHHVKFLVLT
jgi:hypothetical protein